MVIQTCGVVNRLLFGANPQHYTQAVHQGRAMMRVGICQALLGQPAQGAGVFFTQHSFAEEQMWKFCNSRQKALNQL